MHTCIMDPPVYTYCVCSFGASQEVTADLSSSGRFSQDVGSPRSVRR